MWFKPVGGFGGCRGKISVREVGENAFLSQRISRPGEDALNGIEGFARKNFGAFRALARETSAVHGSFCFQNGPPKPKADPF